MTTGGAPIDIDTAVSQSGLPAEVVQKEDEVQREEKELSQEGQVSVAVSAVEVVVLQGEV